MNKSNNFPNILIFSNNCFSKSSSNGRTLSNFFIGWPNKNLAQFYIQNETPDFDVCSNYFRVTDKEALYSIIKKYYPNGSIDVKLTSENNTIKTNTYRNVKRTPITCIVRDIIWNTNKWRNENFELWINKFSPDVILLQAGDSPFMLKLAENIAREKNIPLVIYNSEDYYFKDKNYFRDSSRNSILYKVFINKLRRQFKNTMKYSSHNIYNTDMLKETYYKEFKDNSSVLMTNTSLKGEFKYRNRDKLVISYLGNLGVGRHEPLIQIANSINKIDNKLKLNIYGNIPNQYINDAFKNCNSIDYRGVVPYEEVIKIIEKSDLLIHAENFNEFYQIDLKHAFSTKIADSLASGVCLVLYAPKQLACTNYLLDKNAAYVITDPNSLDEKLSKIISDIDLRKQYAENALILADENHNISKNCEKFRKIIIDVIKKWE